MEKIYGYGKIKLNRLTSGRTDGENRESGDFYLVRPLAEVVGRPGLDFEAVGRSTATRWRSRGEERTVDRLSDGGRRRLRFRQVKKKKKRKEREI